MLSYCIMKVKVKVIIYPAIDIRDGKCVRLIKGDYSQETIYGENPADMAVRWEAEGARILHVVDLDAAKSGLPSNRMAIERILKEVRIPVQLGGGIREDKTIELYTNLGVSRLVVGTRAIKDPEWFALMAEKYPQRLVVGIDAMSGDVATDGWLNSSGVSPIEIAQRLDKLPIAGIVYTDIAKDGMLQGPNIEAMAEMAEAINCPVVASGGVTQVKDVSDLMATKVSGCIIGRALYEGRLSLRDALAAANIGSG